MRKRKTIIRDRFTGRRRVATAAELRANELLHRAVKAEAISSFQRATIAELQKDRKIRDDVIERVSLEFAKAAKPHLEEFISIMERASGRKSFVNEYRATVPAAAHPIRRFTVRIPDITFCYDEPI